MVYVTVRKILFPFVKHGLAEVSGGEHLPEQQPYLLAANHIDYLDGFMIAGAVYTQRHHAVYFLTKTNNYWWTRAALPIDPRKRSESIDDALQYLHKGKVICNFVEGERNPGAHLLPGKTGTARLALQSGLPVIPVGILGPSGASFGDSLTNFVTARKNVSIHFGPPVNLAAYKGQPLDYDILKEATAEIMRSLVPLTGKVYVGQN